MHYFHVTNGQNLLALTSTLPGCDETDQIEVLHFRGYIDANHEMHAVDRLFSAADAKERELTVTAGRYILFNRDIGDINVATGTVELLDGIRSIYVGVETSNDNRRPA